MHKSQLQSILKFQAIFSEKDIEVLRSNITSLANHHRWKAIFKENNLSFYRSMTGRCIYQVVFEKHGSIYIVSTAYVNRNKAEYKITDDTYDIALLNYLIRHMLLK